MPLDFWSLCLQLLGCWNYGHVPGDPMIPGGQTPSFMHSKQAICQLRQIPSPENDVALYTWVLHIMISYLINANFKKSHKKCHPSKWASARRKTTQGWFWSTSVDGFLFLMWSGWDCVEETMNGGNLGQSDTLVEKRQSVLSVWRRLVETQASRQCAYTHFSLLLAVHMIWPAAWVPALASLSDGLEPRMMRQALSHPMLLLSGSFIMITEQRSSVPATTETRLSPTHLLTHDNMMTTQEKQDAPEPCHCLSKPVHCSFQRIDNSRMKEKNNNNNNKQMR